MTLFSAATKVTGFPNEKITAVVGISLWSDTNYTIENLPPILEGAILFRGTYANIPPDTTITVEIIRSSTIYVAVISNMNGGLSSSLKGWTLTHEEVEFNWTNGINYLDEIWKKNVTTPQAINFTTSEEGLTPVIFVKLGKHLQFFKVLLLIKI